MGRYDALTKLEEPKTPTQPVVPHPSKVQQTAKVVSQTHEVKKTSKLANQQTSKNVSPISQPDQTIDTSFLTSKEKTKYGTYLTDESIQKIKLRAIETNRDSHQVLQEAVNLYFKKLAK
jgi:hypothetical protein